MTCYTYTPYDLGDCVLMDYIVIQLACIAAWIIFYCVHVFCFVVHVVAVVYRPLLEEKDELALNLLQAGNMEKYQNVLQKVNTGGVWICIAWGDRGLCVILPSFLPVSELSALSGSSDCMYSTVSILHLPALWTFFYSSLSLLRYCWDKKKGS